MDKTRNKLTLGRQQLWLLPTIITALFAAAAQVATSYAVHIPGADVIGSWLYTGSAATARELLSSLLTSLITMTSLVISVTFVILTLAANQLGPRLITIFMADIQIQFVLGLFLGTILYLVLVLGSLDEEAAAPQLAVTIAIALTVTCLLALLFYVHKIARSINADHVVEKVSKELSLNLREIDHDQPTGKNPTDAPSPSPAHTVSVGSAGYIQVVDYERLVKIASRAEVVLEITVRAGHFILQRGKHVVVHGDRPLSEETEEKIKRAFTIGRERTSAQDPEHGLRQLVEIAVRALSPGINDPYTAMSVLDHLGLAFEQIFGQTLQPRMLCDDQGTVRVIAQRSDILGLLEAAFDPIRQAATAHPAVLIRIADTLGKLAPSLTSDEKRGAALEQLAKLEESARDAALAPSDERDTLHRIEKARKTIEHV